MFVRETITVVDTKDIDTDTQYINIEYRDSYYNKIFET